MLPSAPTDLVFGKYEIIKRLAVGGMGEIFLARESNAIGVDRLVILKNLLPDLAKQADFISAFLDEARVAATLNHPNIVSMYEVGAWKGLYYICMEYIEGENLNGVLDVCDDRGERMPPRIAARIIRDAAVGLAHAHDATKTDGSRLEIVHRDVSPHNIMVRLDGVTKVVDFGIALATTRQTRTATGHIKGKIRYLAPEQIEGKPLDGRTDQYSLGIVFWELLTGVPAYEGESGSILYRKLGSERLRPPSSIVHDLPKPFDDIIATMTATDPTQRYRDCRAVARAIEDEIFGTLQLASNEAQVGELITELVGEAMAKRRRELTPNDFLVNLDKTEPDVRERGHAVTQDATKKVAPRPTSQRGKLAVVGAVMLALSGAAVFMASSPKPIVAPPSASAPPRAAPPPSAPVEAQPQPDPVSQPVPEPTPPAKRPTKQSSMADMRPGVLSVRTVPWTRVSIAGKDYGTTPVLKIELPPGKHTLLLVNEEKHINEQKVVDIKAGCAIDAEHQVEGEPMRHLAIALALCAATCGSDPFAVVIVEDPEHAADGAAELVLSLSSSDAVRRVPLAGPLPLSVAVKSKTGGTAALSVVAQNATGRALARGDIVLDLSTDNAVANRVMLSSVCETDGNECTEDVCDDQFRVSYAPVADGQPCLAAEGGNGVCIEGKCTLCGNGVVDFGEDGEDGNTVPYDGLTNCRNSERQVYLSADPDLTCKLVASGLGPQGQARFSVACDDCTTECTEGPRETHTENGAYVGLAATAFASDGSSVFFGARPTDGRMQLLYIDATPMPAAVPRLTAANLIPRALGALYTTDDQLITWSVDVGVPHITAYGAPPTSRRRRNPTMRVRPSAPSRGPCQEPPSSSSKVRPIRSAAVCSMRPPALSRASSTMSHRAA